MMNEHDVIELLKAIKRIGIEVWLDGGWGVDALIGRQTRPHNDIDIFIEKKNTAAIIELLTAKGYVETKVDFTTQDHTVWRDTCGRTVDLHLYEIGDAGGLYFENIKYDAKIFEGIGKIGELEVRCLTAEAQVLFHQGYDYDENDTQDVLMLCKKYEIPVPSQYKSSKTIARKMGIKDGFRTIFINAPAGIIELLELPNIDLQQGLTGEFDYMHFFAKDSSTLLQEFSLLKTYLKPKGMLWVSWEKAGQNGTDLNLKKVINIGHSHGLVESTTLSINSVWSTIKFTHHKKGKIYNNSYGTLKLDDQKANLKE